MIRIPSLMVAMLAASLAGCPERQTAQRAGTNDSPAEPSPSVALRVAVVNEPEVAEAINRLRGEWAERFGGELSASATTWDDVAAQTSLDADVVVFPSRYLGELSVRGWLRPVRANVLQSEGLDAADIFPLARRELSRWGGQTVALPLGVDLPLVRQPIDRHPAIALLVEAAPKAVSDDRLGVLFDAETMKPRITEPPFLDALAQLAQADEQHGAALSAGPRVSLLGFADRLAAVTTDSRNAASAFKLAAWLASAEISSQLASAGEGTMPVRRSLAASPLWYEPSLTGQERAELGEMLEAALSQDQCLLIPRIPGVDEYVAALDQAVQDAVHGEVAPQTALQTAAERWEQITEAHGRDAQRLAYLKHLGISGP